MTATTQNNSQTVAMGNLPQAILVGGILALLGNIVILYVGRAFGIPFEVIPPGSAGLEQLTIVPLIFASFLPAIAAGVLLGALQRYTPQPFTRFWQISLIILVLSFWGPTEANTDSAATITGLNMMHVMAGVAIIAAFSALGREESPVA